MPGHQLFLDLVIIVTAAAAIAVAARRLRLALIPGYLLIGAIIGAHGVGLVRHAETAESISRLAVILLMFTIGLHMDVGGMRRGLRPIIAVGLVASVALTLIGWPLAMAFGLAAPSAIAVSGALSISSTAVVLKTIQERRELHRPHGRLAFGALLVQDLLAVAMLGGMPLLAAWAGHERGGSAAGALILSVRMLAGIGGIAVMLWVGRAFLPRLLAAAMKTGSGEVLIVLSAAVALGAAAASSALGFSAELGAFLAGFLLASTTFRHQISGQLMPMRDLFMAVFFTTVGLELDMMVIVDQWMGFFPALGLLLAVKFTVTAAAAWGAGATAPTALLTGASLANAGEFSIVLLAGAAGAGVVSEPAEAFVIALIVCSLLVTPIAMDRSHRWAERLAGVGAAPWVRRAAESARRRPAQDGMAAAPDPTAIRHVIIGGYGVVGRFLADRFAALEIPVTVIELNSATVRKQTGLGRSIVFGDVGNREVLESAGIRSADAVVLTIPDEEALFRACPVVRELAPSAMIAARTSYLSQAMVLRSLGADVVVVEEVATAEAMVSQVLPRLAAYQQDKAVGPA